jgi:hypothetical protein
MPQEIVELICTSIQQSALEYRQLSLLRLTLPHGSGTMYLQWVPNFVRSCRIWLVIHKKQTDIRQAGVGERNLVLRCAITGTCPDPRLLRGFQAGRPGLMPGMPGRMLLPVE